MESIENGLVVNLTTTEESTNEVLIVVRNIQKDVDELFELNEELKESFSEQRKTNSQIMYLLNELIEVNKEIKVDVESLKVGSWTDRYGVM